MSGPENCDVCDRFIEEDDGMVVAHEDCLDTDDARDGRALRLLREALPVGASLRVLRYGGGLVTAVGYEHSWRPEGRKRMRYEREWGTGSTIAEAADACRSALEARS